MKRLLCLLAIVVFGVTLVAARKRHNPTITLSLTSTTTTVGQLFTVGLTAYDADQNLAGGSLNWGDGSALATWNGQPPATLTHTYQVAGSDTLQAVEKDSTGGQGTASFTITVNPLPVPPPPPPPPPPIPSSTLTFVLDTFESGVNQVTNPNEPNPLNGHKWGLLTDYGNGSSSPTTVQTAVVHSGSYALRQHFDQDAENQNYALSAGSGQTFLQAWGHLPNWQFYLRPYFNPGNFVPPQTSAWNWVSIFSSNPATWAANPKRINRLSLWMKLPAQIVAPPPGQHNLEIATEQRTLEDAAISTLTYRSQGWHWYHFYNVESMNGAWLHLLFDPHPNHRVSSDPTADWHDETFPIMNDGSGTYSASAARYTAANYFDLLTSIYADFYAFDGQHSPADFYLDDAVVYEETDPHEDVEHVYSLWGGFDPTTNTVKVGWNHPKGDGTTHHTVKYQFDSKITDWNAAIAPPNNDIAPLDLYSVNMRWSSSAIDMSGHRTIWVGIQAAGQSGWRQIDMALP